MNMLLRAVAVGLFLSGGLPMTAWAEDAKPAPKISEEALTPAEEVLANLLTGADLVGSFTVDGKEGQPKQDRYSISKAARIKGNHWAIHARIKYGEVDITVPVPVQIDWAQDTPVLSVSDLKIPGLGSEFGTRLLFHGDRYAGTWQHGKVGGHMWGRIERTPVAPSK